MSTELNLDTDYAVRPTRQNIVNVIENESVNTSYGQFSAPHTLSGIANNPFGAALFIAQQNDLSPLSSNGSKEVAPPIPLYTINDTEEDNPSDEANMTFSLYALMLLIIASALSGQKFQIEQFDTQKRLIRTEANKNIAELRKAQLQRLISELVGGGLSVLGAVASSVAAYNSKSYSNQASHAQSQAKNPAGLVNPRVSESIPAKVDKYIAAHPTNAGGLNGAVNPNANFNHTANGTSMRQGLGHPNRLQWDPRMEEFGLHKIDVDIYNYSPAGMNPVPQVQYAQNRYTTQANHYNAKAQQATTSAQVINSLCQSFGQMGKAGFTYMATEHDINAKDHEVNQRIAEFTMQFHRSNFDTHGQTAVQTVSNFSRLVQMERDAFRYPITI